MDLGLWFELRDRYGTYGTQGLADPSNVPGARYDSVSWLDPTGNLWLFGGYGIFTDVGGWDLGNDLWRYDPFNSTWTWMSGSTGGEQAGTYGTNGVADPSNVPGARQQAVSWVDPSGALWLFGGMGYGSASGSAGMLNDLWKYDPSNRTWTWISGTDAVDQPGIYGTKGVADTSNVPGARCGAASWIDLGGNLWLFGGAGPGYDHLNDLWKFDPATREWTWVSGSDIPDQAGVYGIKCLADPSNVPGGETLRYRSAIPAADSGFSAGPATIRPATAPSSMMYGCTIRRPANGPGQPVATSASSSVCMG